ncbi:putative ubiquinone biosynthesis monooxygenase [Coemansia sp. Benny D115]|nr:putative ubiquinone biosynthesis monooxygenase [Coemansia sp. Benny D115]
MNSARSAAAWLRMRHCVGSGRAAARSVSSVVAQPETGTAGSTDPRLYDVVIVGGGAAGCALASVLGLSKRLKNLRVALVDPGKLEDTRKWEPPTDTYLPRTLQITQSNKKYLESHGIWDQCYTDRVQACDRAVVTDAAGGGKLDLDVRDYGVSSESVAYMIETKNLVSGMLRSVHKGGAVDVYERVKVASIDRGSFAATKWPVVALSDKRRLQARLLIGADGGNSAVRKYAGIGVYGTEYKQYGLVATMCLEELNGAAFQRFLPSGPIALLPFPGGFANLIWSLGTEQVQLLKTVSDDTFAGLVNAAFRLTPGEIEYFAGMIRAGASSEAVKAEVCWRLDVFAQNNKADNGQAGVLPPVAAAVLPKSRLSFPLRMRIVDSLVGERVALVGDAGHVMHPLAGQGLNMGLEDVQSLVGVLERAVGAGQDIGSRDVLQGYARQRHVRNLAMQGVVDKVWHVFGTDIKPVTWARSLAMSGLDLVPGIKRLLVKSMMS